ncbi:MAG: hypothetical protein ACFFBQ_15635 [Promethearchaeota archaeon]
MPFDKLFRKISGQEEVITLGEFQERLERLISVIKQKYEDSKLAEQDYLVEYDEKLSKLDFKGSKQAVEEGRHQLTKTLEYDVQLDFLKKIQVLARRIPEENTLTEDFYLITKQVLDLRKLRSESNRKILLKRFKKYAPSADDALLMGLDSDDEINQIIRDVQEGTPSSLDNEAEKIIEEVRNKKTKHND